MQMDFSSYLNQIHVEDSADQLVSVMRSGHNLLVTDDSWLPLFELILAYLIIEALI